MATSTTERQASPAPTAEATAVCAGILLASSLLTADFHFEQAGPFGIFQARRDSKKQKGGIQAGSALLQVEEQKQEPVSIAYTPEWQALLEHRKDIESL